MQTRFIVGGALILGAMVAISIATYFANQTAYYTVDELVANADLYHPSGAVRAAGVADAADGVEAVGAEGAADVARAADAAGAFDAATGPRMKIRGTVDDETVGRGEDGMTLSFTLTGKDGALPVVYRGIVPDAFDLAEVITVGGRLGADGTFVADELSVQCPSKYEAVPPGRVPAGDGALDDGAAPDSQSPGTSSSEGSSEESSEGSSEG